MGTETHFWHRYADMGSVRHSARDRARRGRVDMGRGREPIPGRDWRPVVRERGAWQTRDSFGRRRPDAAARRLLSIF